MDDTPAFTSHRWSQEIEDMVYGTPLYLTISGRKVKVVADEIKIWRDHWANGLDLTPYQWKSTRTFRRLRHQRRSVTKR